MTASELERQELVSLMLGHQMRRDMRQVRQEPLVVDSLRGVHLNWSEPTLDQDLDRYIMTGVDKGGKEVVTLLYGIEEEPNGPRIATYASARVLVGTDISVEIDIEHTSPTASTVTLAALA